MARLQIDRTRNFASKHKSAGNYRKAPIYNFKRIEILSGSSKPIQQVYSGFSGKMVAIQINSKKKDAKWIWNNKHEKAFPKVNNDVRKVAKLTQFKKNKPSRIICYASKNVLGAVFQQCEENT